MFPKDPFILLSVINTKLRDEYNILDELCASMDVDKSQLQKTLEESGFEYNPAINQFK